MSDKLYELMDWPEIEQLYILKNMRPERSSDHM